MVVDGVCYQKDLVGDVQKYDRGNQEVDHRVIAWKILCQVFCIVRQPNVELPKVCF
jgi:hypothetical protein